MATPVTLSEVHELTSEGGFQCQNWVDMNSHGSTGGLLGSTPLICGGNRNGITSDTCYTLDKDEAKNVTKMLVKRAHSTSIIIDSNILWVTGGKDSETKIVYSSSEYVNIGFTNPGPDLPRPLFMHAMVSVQETITMVIGGANLNGTTTDSDLTHIYDHKRERWANGPTLNMGRASHAAFIVTDLVTDERLVIAAGGYQGSITLNSTEILVGNRWSQGNNLTFYFYKSTDIRMNNWAIFECKKYIVVIYFMLL